MLVSQLLQKLKQEEGKYYPVTAKKKKRGGGDALTSKVQFIK